MAGVWGQWWHQMFRFGFLSSAHAILNLLPMKLARNVYIRRTVQFFTAFIISAVMHALGSYAQPAPTDPIRGPFMFFILQLVGIILQESAKFVLVSIARSLRSSSSPSPSPSSPHKHHLQSPFPRWLGRSTNLIFTCFWLLAWGYTIADDFTISGLWLTEFVPVSLLRGLGLGLEGQGWWCAQEPMFRYWTDGTFWGSGLRVL